MKIIFSVIGILLVVSSICGYLSFREYIGSDILLVVFGGWGIVFLSIALLFDRVDKLRAEVNVLKNSK